MDRGNGSLSRDLTKRELDILYGVSLGLANNQIAFVLGIRQQTVKNHLTAIYGKLLPDRLNGERGRKYHTLAVMEAMKRGILA